jgi:hypothetical protein
MQLEETMHACSALAVACFAISAASGGTISYTGTLASPSDSSTEITVTLASAGNLLLQTWGFGGGTNAAGAVIPAGGFDPFVGVFAGVGGSAVLIDGTSDVLSNYLGFTGCPPAGTVDIGGAVCGDVSMTFSLAAGTYTVLLTDGLYIPNAVFETNGVLADGFTDLTAGVFQTCNGANCVSDTANWALDITTPGTTAPVPEPGGPWLCGIGLVVLSAASRRLSRPKSKAIKLVQ